MQFTGIRSDAKGRHRLAENTLCFGLQVRDGATLLGKPKSSENEIQKRLIE